MRHIFRSPPLGADPQQAEPSSSPLVTQPRNAGRGAVWQRRDRRGIAFTLPNVLIVIGILIFAGILTAIGLRAFSSSSADQQDLVAQQNIDSVVERILRLEAPAALDRQKRVTFPVICSLLAKDEDVFTLSSGTNTKLTPDNLITHAGEVKTATRPTDGSTDCPVLNSSDVATTPGSITIDTPQDPLRNPPPTITPNVNKSLGIEWQGAVYLIPTGDTSDNSDHNRVFVVGAISGSGNSWCKRVVLSNSADSAKPTLGSAKVFSYGESGDELATCLADSTTPTPTKYTKDGRWGIPQ